MTAGTTLRSSAADATHDGGVARFPHLLAAPQVHANAFVAPNATVVGDVHIGEGSSVWFGSVLRGDVQAIRIGRGSNVQDLSVVHASTNGLPTTLGDHVTVGHAAILHSCTLHDFAFVGFGACVLDGAVVEADGMLAAGAVLTPGKVLGAGELWAGNPARFVRKLDEKEIARNRQIAPRYSLLAQAHRSGSVGTR